MVWTTTALFFLACIPALWIGFWVYAKGLHALGTHGALLRNTMGLLWQALFPLLLVAPLVAPVFVVPEWRTALGSSPAYVGFYTLCYVVALVPGARHFIRHHLRDLRAMGYFAGMRRY